MLMKLGLPVVALLSLLHAVHAASIENFSATLGWYVAFLGFAGHVYVFNRISERGS